MKSIMYKIVRVSDGVIVNEGSRLSMRNKVRQMSGVHAVIVGNPFQRQIGVTVNEDTLRIVRQNLGLNS